MTTPISSKYAFEFFMVFSFGKLGIHALNILSKRWNLSSRVNGDILCKTQETLFSDAANSERTVLQYNQWIVEEEKKNNEKTGKNNENKKNQTHKNREQDEDQQKNKKEKDKNFLRIKITYRN